MDQLRQESLSNIDYAYHTEAARIRRTARHQLWERFSERIHPPVWWLATRGCREALQLQMASAMVSHVRGTFNILEIDTRLLSMALMDRSIHVSSVSTAEPGERKNLLREPVKEA